jgi:hypothetical protein
MMSVPVKRSDKHVTRACAVLLCAFLLVVLNWQSSLGVQSCSTNVDLVAFGLAVLALPIALFYRAKQLPRMARRSLQALALCMLAFGGLVWLWNFHNFRDMARGFEFEPVVTTIPFEGGRIAAYQIETAPAGAYVSLRRQYRFLPGLYLSREFAVVDSPTLTKLALVSPRQLCVAFPSLRTDLIGRQYLLQVLVPVKSFLARDTTIVRDIDGVLALDRSTNCTGVSTVNP